MLSLPPLASTAHLEKKSKVGSGRQLVAAMSDSLVGMRQNIASSLLTHPANQATHSTPPQT